MGQVIVERPGKGLARLEANAAALAPINEALTGLPEAMSIAGTCHYLIEHASGHLEFDARFVGRAKSALGHLSHVPSADQAHSKMLDILIPGPGDEVTFTAACFRFCSARSASG